MLYRGIVLTFLALLGVSALAQDDFRCVSCQRVVERGYKLDGKFYCPDHLQDVLPRCFNCQTPIDGNYVAVTPDQFPVCMRCRDALPQCFLCSLPCDGERGGVAFADGRFACRLHATGGVTDSARARQIFSRARRELASTFGGVLDIKTPIQGVLLVDVQGLIQAARQSGHNPSLSNGRVLGIATVVLVSRQGRRTMDPSTVHLLNNVPEDRLLTVCTHEYAHVWHAENHKDYSQTQPVLREGFAEWVAYKVAQKHGRTGQMKLMMNPNGGVYYQGLLKFLELERQKGVPGVLQFATSSITI